MKIHRRYSDKADRPDLRALALCNNINGPICDKAHLTSDDSKVSCGRCKRISADSQAVPRKAFSDAALRRNSREMPSPMSRAETALWNTKLAKSAESARAKARETTLTLAARAKLERAAPALLAAVKDARAFLLDGEAFDGPLTVVDILNAAIVQAVGREGFDAMNTVEEL